LKPVCSNFVDVSSGVPQDSVLGPILFLVYINDIIDSIRCCHIKLFVDDTGIYLPIKTAADMDHFQHDLDQLSEWADKWDMSFNVTKSYSIIFSQPSVSLTMPHIT
jgi:hypothetical protein